MGTDSVLYLGIASDSTYFSMHAHSFIPFIKLYTYNSDLTLNIIIIKTTRENSDLNYMIRVVH